METHDGSAVKTGNAVLNYSAVICSYLCFKLMEPAVTTAFDRGKPGSRR